MILKVISGGQTGADRIGLEVAHALQIPTGGTAPLGFKTESGPDLELRDKFRLKESTSSHYAVRTAQNIMDSDLTLVFGDVTSPGSRATIAYCQQQNKPCLKNPTADEIVRAVAVYNAKVINVAGNRGSKLSQHDRNVMRERLMQALVMINYITVSQKN